MDLQKELIESSKIRKKGRGKRVRASATSIALHAMLVAGVVYAGTHRLSHKIDAQEPIAVFLSKGAAPPPPPPPLPPKGGGGQPSTPHVQIKPVEIPTEVNPLTPPVETPTEIPLPVADTSLPVADTSSVTESVPGGVEGGVEGGIVGGEVGGVVGGELGGVKGGEVGGVVGGTVGGTGTGTEGNGTGGSDAPPSGPMRVGGNVKAPVTLDRVSPDYTETARKAKIAGTVVVEAIIGTNGRVQDVRVIKGLPMGLSEEAEQAVKKWRFKPGTLNGEPVAVIFNLTVNFALNGS